MTKLGESIRSRGGTVAVQDFHVWMAMENGKPKQDGGMSTQMVSAEWERQHLPELVEALQGFWCQVFEELFSDPELEVRLVIMTSLMNSPNGAPIDGSWNSFLKIHHWKTKGGRSQAIVRSLHISRAYMMGGPDSIEVVFAAALSSADPVMAAVAYANTEYSKGRASLRPRSTCPREWMCEHGRHGDCRDCAAITELEHGRREPAGLSRIIFTWPGPPGTLSELLRHHQHLQHLQYLPQQQYLPPHLQCLPQHLIDCFAALSYRQ
jgi:hypothetical protein